MNKTFLILFVAGLLFPLTLISMEVGRRFGRRRLAEDPEGARASASAVESAVFALFGLLIAFTFTSAASRYETRGTRLCSILTPSALPGCAWTCSRRRSSLCCGRISVFI